MIQNCTMCQPVAQRVKGLPTMQETRVRSLGREDPLEKKMATYSSILTWKIPWTEEPGRLQSIGSQRVGHDSVTSLSLFTFRLFLTAPPLIRGLPWWLSGKEFTNAGDAGLILGPERSPGEGNGNSLQYPCLENSMDRGACRSIVHRVTNCRM